MNKWQYQSGKTVHFPKPTTLQLEMSLILSRSIDNIKDLIDILSSLVDRHKELMDKYEKNIQLKHELA